MQHLVLHHVGMLRERLLAAGTLVRLQTCCEEQESNESDFRLTSDCVIINLKGFAEGVEELTIVHQVMALQVRQLRECFVANGAERRQKNVI